MNILAFDTATNWLLCGVRTTDNSKYTITRQTGLRHGEMLLSVVDSLLREAKLQVSELDLVVCTEGPGSFTGLRIGMSTAKGLSYSHQIPLVSIPTLDNYSWGYDHFTGAVVPVMDARKNRFYTALYKQGKRTTEYLDLTPSELKLLCRKEERILLTGPDAQMCYTSCFSGENEELETEVFCAPYEPDPSPMFFIGTTKYETEGKDSPDKGPLYLRKSEAELSLNRTEDER